MKVSIGLPALCALCVLCELILWSPANAAGRYAFETRRASAPLRDPPVSKSECEKMARAYARDQAPLLAKIGEPMDAGCVKVND